MSNCCNNKGAGCSCGSFAHPRVIFNPPGLDFITYRAGDYAEFRRALLKSLEGETELSSTQGGVTTPIWQPSEQGDLALQMMEWWAYLADILTFYNQRVATQAYLRTADLPESVNRLVRLLGYRPRPGIGATGIVAALASSPRLFTLQAGFAVQSKPGPGKQPQIFELDADTTVGVTRSGPVPAALALGMAGARRIDDPSQLPINGNMFTLAGSSSAVKKGDEVLVLPRNFASSPGAFALATVVNVAPGADPSLGAITKIQVKWETAASSISGLSQLQLYKSGQSTQVWQFPAGAGKVVRNLGSASAGTIDLASIVRGIKSNDPVLFQSSPSAFHLLVVKDTTEVIWYANPKGNAPPASPAATVDPAVPPDSTASPGIAIPHTRIAFTAALPLGSSLTVRTGAEISQTSGILENDFVSKKMDMSTSLISEVQSDVSLAQSDVALGIRGRGSITDTPANRTQFSVRHSWVPVDDLITLPAGTVGGTGSQSDVTLEPTAGGAFPSAAAGAAALVEDSVGSGASGVVTSSTAMVLPGPVPLLIPPLQAYFNLLSVSRGKTVAGEVVGSGNAALSGQDFALQNAPVTYLQNADSRSGDNYSSTVNVWVNGLQWMEVRSFFDQPSDAQVFVTREDDSGKTHVVFGDGEFGARLPTGSGNVTATYRYGSGAEAPAAGSLTVVLKPQPGLRSLRNPLAAGGGADPDAPAKLRKLAPRSVLAFGRAVSADDYQVIAAQAPGVVRAAAAFAFDPVEQRPRVTVWVGDDDGAVTAAGAAIAAGADPNRLPAVLPATRVQVALSLSIVVDPRRHAADVLSAVKSALLDPDAGLLGLNVVEIGQSIYDSEIYAACLAVPGALAVRGLAFSSAGFHILQLRRVVHGATCAERRHDPGAGGYFFLPDDGQSLVLSVETS